jgi:hypothetical protein
MKVVQEGQSSRTSKYLYIDKCLVSFSAELTAVLADFNGINQFIHSMAGTINITATAVSVDCLRKLFEAVQPLQLRISVSIDI